MLENKRKVTKKQLLLLLEEIENKPILSHDITLNGDKKIYDQDWEKLVIKLNAVPSGAKRSVPRWKTVLKDWKLTVKKQANSDETPDDIGKRLLQLVEREESHQDTDNESIPEVIIPEAESENEVFRRPLLRVLGKKRPRLVISGLAEGSLLYQQKRLKSLNTIYNHDIDGKKNPEQFIMSMQLNRLHEVSQQLEDHIKQVQDRIQRIKDMWQHDCADDDV